MARSAIRWFVTVLSLITIAGLGVDAYVHLTLASGYALVRTEMVSQATLFRVEGIAAALSALCLLVRPNRLTAFVAFLVSAAGVAAVVGYTEFDPGRIGPLPDMYEPVWYPEKTNSLIAEAIAAVGAVVMLLVLMRSRVARIGGGWRKRYAASSPRRCWTRPLPPGPPTDGRPAQQAGRSRRP